MDAKDRQYWVRNQQGRTWGPYDLEALERLRGIVSVQWQVSLEGTRFRPIGEFPELTELAQAPRRPAPPASPEPPARAIASPAPARPAAAPPSPAGTPGAAGPIISIPPTQLAELPVLPEEGELESYPPLRLYALAALSSASGWLQLHSPAGAMLQLSFRRGTPEHLESDDPELSLLSFLRGRGTVTGPQALEAKAHSEKAGVDLVTALFQRQLIPPADAHRLLKEHMLSLLDRALMMWRGTFSFERDAPPPPGAFPLGQRWTLLAESIRRLDPLPLRARLGARLGQPVLRSGGLALGRVEELALTAQETRLYAAIDGVRTGEQLLAESQDPNATLRLLYLLAELGHLAFAAVEAPRAPAQPGATPSRGSTPIAAAPPPRPPAAPRAPAPAPSLSPPPPRPPAPAPGKPAPAPPRPAAPAAAPPATFVSGPSGETPAAMQARLAAVLARIEKADHFAALGVDRKASAPDIKKAFFQLARELHPDTVQDGNAALRDLKSALFARVNEAAQVLSDEKRRKEHEDQLDGKGSVDVARIFAAEEAFQRGEIMIKARKLAEGLALIEEAISLNAEEGEFYAWRGWARFLLSKDRKTQHPLSAADCRKALSMIAKCVPAWLFLGNMAKAMNEPGEAEKSYRKVLELEPRNVDAQRELRAMGKKI